jgi:hypothetical protein
MYQFRLSIRPSVGHTGELKVASSGLQLMEQSIRVQKQISDVSAKMADNNFIQHKSILRSAFVAKVADRLASLSPNNKSF